MAALTVLGGTSALLALGITLFRRRLSSKWLTSSSITNPTTLTQQHTIIITGGNTGLGYETALDLSQRGGTILLACRDTVAGERAVHTIRSMTNNDHVHCMELDLASLESIRKFAAEVQQRYPSIYALVCNAGVWMPMDKHEKTKDGYEIHFGLNHLGHFLLIQELVPHMIQSGTAGRVVLVSSSLSKMGVIDMDTKDFIKEGRAQPEKSFAPSGYCDSKLMNALTCRHLAKVLEEKQGSSSSGGESNITTYSVCPGFCVSDLGRYMTRPLYQKMFIVPMMRLFQRSTVQGAQNIVFATVEDTSKLVNGGFYQDGKVNEEMLTSHQEIETPLWNLSMELIKEK
ncbi:hypothetical protein HJC23_004444 [Cyclotella cryptica]|uniref:Protochlorophyllide reductase n=1 Tax=Cyclotella cryptica TaxID=29204 RepID=A0ABD3QE82_9STRA|eukprot:CCRYP_006064-RA/>CCRYP_006064-RA protein AED:0.00 eAED:-0.00 QI:0/-1/0/1/-1/1/1/0/342